MPNLKRTAKMKEVLSVTVKTGLKIASPFRPHLPLTPEYSISPTEGIF